ncbi:hypothetical protein Scep_000839 [Stephania cephalantha]|uniref:Protein root UVB sensitive/RUS domain-containing protein n=1 Tax=Stephania cephalantha TaxID=152367 RepID=A0AAP0L8A4_9MAGN
MQTALKPPPDTTLVPRLQRNAFHRRTLSPIPKPYKPPSLIPSLSLRTSYEGTHRGEGQGQGQGPNTIRLPLVIRESGSISRYLWDGTDLHLVRVDGDAANHWFDSHDCFHKFARFCGTKLRNFFVPRQVERNYLEYVKWKFFHRVSSSALQVLATQAMFRAMGFGYSHSLSSAAALNWVLKDGLGRLCRCIYTASLASAFDTNLKMVRFSTSVVFTLSIGIELLTPCFPQCFLLLATIANIAKQISLACYLATGSAVHRSFAIADNLGEVSAKSQIQTVCFDNLGLLLAALLNMLCKNSQRLQAGLPFLVYPLFSAVDLFGIYQGLKHVHLPTLTKDRIEIIIDAWIHLGFVPSPAEVSKEEGIGFQWKKGRKRWPIRIGCAYPRDRSYKLPVLTMCSLRSEDFYFLCMESSKRGLRRNMGHSSLSTGRCRHDRYYHGLASVATNKLWTEEACHIREELANRIHWEHLQRGDDLSESFLKEWLEVLEDSQRRASDEVNLLKEEMCRAGWAVKSVLLSVQEQARYSLLGV